MSQRARKFYTRIYNELSEEIKKDKYKNMFIEHRYGRRGLFIDNVEKSLTMWQNTFNNNFCIIQTDYDGENVKRFEFSKFQELFKGIIDFDEWHKLENMEGHIKELSSKDLLDKKVILDKNKFLDKYFSIVYPRINVTRLPNICLKDLNVKQLVHLYFNTVLFEIDPEDAVIGYVED